MDVKRKVIGQLLAKQGIPHPTKETLRVSRWNMVIKKALSLYEKFKRYAPPT